MLVVAFHGRDRSSSVLLGSLALSSVQTRLSSFLSTVQHLTASNRALAGMGSSIRSALGQDLHSPHPLFLHAAGPLCTQVWAPQPVSERTLFHKKMAHFHHNAATARERIPRCQVWMVAVLHALRGPSEPQSMPRPPCTDHLDLSQPDTQLTCAFVSSTQVPGCHADLSTEKPYSQRKRICSHHMQVRQNNSQHSTPCGDTGRDRPQLPPYICILTASHSTTVNMLLPHYRCCLQAPVLEYPGHILCRYCFQCAKVEPIQAFDGTKR